MALTEHAACPTNQSKVDWLLSDERNFDLYPGRPHCRYLLCSTARCGSNLVGDMLRQTGHAGDPLEYLNKRYIAGVMRKRAPTDQSMQVDLSSYLTALERVRTSSNGYFGMKAHFEHVEPLLRQRPQDAERLLRRFDDFILLRRRDKLAQAVSLYRARMAQIWSSLDYKFMAEDDPRRKMDIPFDAVKIARALADICHQEKGWEDTLVRFSLPFRVFWYEDFVAEYMPTSKSLLHALKIAADGVLPAAPKLEKQASQNDPFVLLFRDALGLNAE